MIGVFLQVRLDSVRLPRKALLPLGGKPLIQQAMFRLLEIHADVYAVLTTEDSLAALGQHIVEPFKVFVGPKEDVLGRFIEAVEYYGVDTVVRATGDNPLVNPELCVWLLDEHFERMADLSYAEGAAVGAAVDIVSADALRSAHGLACSPEDREHVTTYIKERPYMYAIHRPLVPRRWQSMARLTVDTFDDYEAIKRFF